MRDSRPEVLRQIGQLSSGTVCSLDRGYVAIDAARLAFYQWTEDRIAEGRLFSRWQEAWHAYAAVRS